MGLYIDGKPVTVEPLIINELLQGYIDWRKTLGGEKVTNPNFTGNATGWTLNTGWTYNANAVDRDGAGTATMEQDVSAVVGEVYRVEYQISAYTDGSVTVSIGGTSGTSRSSAATFVEYLKAATTGNLIFTPVANATFTIDNVSVKKVGYVAADGVTAWIEDRGATAGKGALHFVTEDGTGHVFGDRVGIGTLYPAVFCEINGAVTLTTGDVTVASTYGLIVPSTGWTGFASSILNDTVSAYVELFGKDFSGDAAGQIRIKAGTVSSPSGNQGAILFYSGANLERMRIDRDGLIQIASGLTLAGAGTGANGFKLKNLKNAAATALSGTQLDVEIDIGGTPYYFTVYPTKA